MDILGECAGVELAKRFYLPGIKITSQCPRCGAAYELDMGERYLSYPVVGQPAKVHGYCEKCEHEWLLGSVVVGVTLTIAQEKL